MRPPVFCPAEPPCEGRGARGLSPRRTGRSEGTSTAMTVRPRWTLTELRRRRAGGRTGKFLRDLGEPTPRGGARWAPRGEVQFPFAQYTASISPGHSGSRAVPCGPISVKHGDTSWIYVPTTASSSVTRSRMSSTRSRRGSLYASWGRPRGGRTPQGMHGVGGELGLVELDHGLDATPVVIGHLGAACDRFPDRLDLQGHGLPPCDDGVRGRPTPRGRGARPRPQDIP